MKPGQKKIMSPTGSTRIDRRDFFKFLGGGMAVYFSGGILGAQETSTEDGPKGAEADFNAYVKIGENGRITCYTGKVELGQGIITSLAQTAAEVDKNTGRIQVKKVVCAQDMGLVINPEGAKMQMEGCIMMGLGYTLSEEIHFKGGEIFDLNFGAYEIPRFSWMPKIETVLVDDPHSAPKGGGEPAIMLMGAVIANAVFDATGVRLFQLPMTAERVKEGAGGKRQGENAQGKEHGNERKGVRETAHRT